MTKTDCFYFPNDPDGFNLVNYSYFSNEFYLYYRIQTEYPKMENIENEIIYH